MRGHGDGDPDGAAHRRRLLSRRRRRRRHPARRRRRGELQGAALFRHHRSTQLDPLPGWGVNVLRLLFTWEAYEPSPGTYDDAYLSYYEGVVDAAAARGLWVVVDFHQDAFSRASIGGCGEGFPQWAVPPTVTPAAPDNGADCANWGSACSATPTCPRPGTRSTPTRTARARATWRWSGASPARWPGATTSSASTCSTSPKATSAPSSGRSTRTRRRRSAPPTRARSCSSRPAT